MFPLPPDRPVRTGLIGFGYAGRTFHAPLLRATPGLDLAAVASRQAAAVVQTLGDGVAVHADAAELLARPDLDLVVIATPNDTHAPLARAALASGKAVVVDKPFALNTTEAASLVALAEARSLLLSVFHNRRWDGDFLTARALVAGGQLGRLTEAALHFDRFRAQVRPRWREAAGPGGGLFIDLMPHLMDQALQLFGPPVALWADLAALRDGAQAEDHAVVHLRYAHGLRVHLHASALAAWPGPRFLLQGTRGGWCKWGLDPQEDALRAGHRPDPDVPGDWGIDTQVGQLALADDPAEPDRLRVQPWPNLPGRYPDYYRAIVAALRGQGPNPVPAPEALAVMRALDLARRSAAAGRELPIDAA